MPVQETVVDLQIQSALISAGAALLGSLIGAAASLLAVWLTKSTGQWESVPLCKDGILQEFFA